MTSIPVIACVVYGIGMSIKIGREIVGMFFRLLLSFSFLLVVVHMYIHTYVCMYVCCSDYNDEFVPSDSHVLAYTYRHTVNVVCMELLEWLRDWSCSRGGSGVMLVCEVCEVRWLCEVCDLRQTYWSCRACGVWCVVVCALELVAVTSHERPH